MQVVLYELNEVPWRVFDYYVSRKPNSGLARLATQSYTATTVTRDQGELHPWTTWPSLHRGVYNFEHQIRFLNQSIETAYPPIWKILADNGISCGIFGSLQSYPLMERGQPNYAFYVPDTFSPESDTMPKRYQYFQAFNLMMTNRDGAYAKPIRMDLRSVWSLVRMGTTGLRPRTAVQLAKHLFYERRNALHKTRRAMMQAPVAFDFFIDALKKNPDVEFSTFFTNHVAGIMHRYWKYSFPEDFGMEVKSAADMFRADSLIKAMDIASEQVALLSRWCEQRGAILIVSASMGQEAIHRPKYHGEFRIENSEAFLSGVGWNEFAEVNLAMQPDFAFKLADTNARDRFRQKVSCLCNEDGTSMFGFKESGHTLNINLRPALASLEASKVWWKTDEALRERVLEDFGMGKFERDPGTGYHQPKGIFIASGPSIIANDSREEVELTTVAPTILNLFGMSPRPYMKSNILGLVPNES